MTAVPSQNSVIFYLGLEGLGGLDMDSDEEENVGYNLAIPCNISGSIMDVYRDCKALLNSQGPLQTSTSLRFAYKTVSAPKTSLHISHPQLLFRTSQYGCGNWCPFPCIRRTHRENALSRTPSTAWDYLASQRTNPPKYTTRSPTDS